MKKSRLSNRLLLVAILGIGSWGCQRTSGPSDGTGGEERAGSSGGTTGSGGSAGSGGSSGDQSGGATGSGGSTASTGTAPSDKLPCDVYKDMDGGKCVAAHSTVRRLLSSYDGPLYQVRVGGSKSGTGGATTEIEIGADGFANSGAQDEACGTETCTISKIYDQSGMGNHLTVAPAGGAKKTPDNEANAKALRIEFGGRFVYGVKILPGVGYRNNAAQGLAKGDDPETEYMVVGGKFYNGTCCFDYGNMETNSMDNGEGTMEAVYFGNCTIWNRGGGDGPWVMGDLENGLWAGNTKTYDGNPSLSYDYVSGFVKGDKAGMNHWAIKVGDAQSGGLNTYFDGTRPSDRYNPMRKEGAVGLGTGGDNSNTAQGLWFEGIMTDHFSSNAADDAVQANIVSVYGQFPK